VKTQSRDRVQQVKKTFERESRQRWEGGRGRDRTTVEGVEWASKKVLERGSGQHGRKARGGLPKVSLWPAMPYLSTSCGRATLETALRPFKRLPACREGGLWPSSTPLDTPRHVPMGP
jgi:hypothetical protein